MKKLLPLFIAVITVMSLTGCKSQEERELEDLQSQFANEVAQEQEKSETKKNEYEKKQAEIEKINNKYVTKMTKNLNIAANTEVVSKLNTAVKTYNTDYKSYVKEYSKIANESAAQYTLKQNIGLMTVISQRAINTKKIYINNKNKMSSYGTMNICYQEKGSDIAGILYNNTDEQINNATYINKNGNVCDVNVQSLVPADASYATFKFAIDDKLYYEVCANGDFMNYEIDASSSSATVINTNVDAYELKNQNNVITIQNSNTELANYFKKIAEF